ncbi:hypothetical protein ACA910_015448 [Epithemia clementina (nom. ined.)]
MMLQRSLFFVLLCALLLEFALCRLLDPNSDYSQYRQRDADDTTDKDSNNLNDHDSTEQDRGADGVVDTIVDNNENNNLHNTTSMCERIHPEDLPEECVCYEKPPLGLVVQCLKVFNSTYFNDTIGMTIDVDPCNPDGSSVTVFVTELDHHIHYVIASVKAGEEKDFPIPGLSFIVPGLGHAGVDVAIYIAGNPDDLLMKIGLNACVVTTYRTICASSIPGLNMIFPWWVLSGTYHFGDICETNTNAVAMVESSDTADQ